MSECYVCNTLLTNENSSKEHIIPQALGGRLKSSALLCKTCNNSFGEKSDAELCKQFAYLMEIAQVPRERPMNRGVILEDERDPNRKMRLKNGELTLVETEPLVTANSIQFTANNISDARKTLEGLKRKKHPNLDIDSVLSNVQLRQEYNTPTKMQNSFGGEETFLSVLKTAVNYYLHLKPEKVSFVQDAIKDLQNNITVRVEPFIPTASIYLPDEDEISHIIFLCGDKSKQALYAIISYFNIISYVVHLNDEYSGDDFFETYVYDVFRSKDIAAEKTIPRPPTDEVVMYKYVTYHDHKAIHDGIHASYSRVFKILKKQRKLV